MSATLVHIPGAKDFRDRLPRHSGKNYSLRQLSAIEKIAVHHSLTKNGNARSFARHHVKHNNWPGIGYHFVIEKDGDLKWCNDIEVKSYHVGKSNEKAIGICVVGDFRDEMLEEKQLSPLMKLLNFLLKEFGLTADDVLGHNEFAGYNSKACPSFDMNQIRQSLKGKEKITSSKLSTIEELSDWSNPRALFNPNDFATRPGESVIAAAHRFGLFNLGDIKDRNRDLNIKKPNQDRVKVKVKGPVETIPKDIQALIRTFDQKGYQLFKDDHRPYNLNIVGLRHDSIVQNAFDDEICIFWKYKNVWTLKKYKVTTDPGLTYLRDPINEQGTAILKEGQYRGTFKLGLHRQKYTALVQAAPVTVIRDFNQDDRLDFNTGVEQTGFFGINIHRSSPSGESTLVNKWSAGCQVFANINHYNEFIQICKKATSEWGDLLTYTLVRKRELVSA